MRSWRESGHLVARFFGSLSRAQPASSQVAWLEAKLTPQEVALVDAMSPADRRHAVACARKLEALLGAAASDDLIAAAALHDVGKTEAQIGTLDRVVATVAGKLATTSRVESWLSNGGRRRSYAIYLDHDARGADLLESLGSAPVVVTWAREHHMDEADWSLPADWGRGLAAADLVRSSSI